MLSGKRSSSLEQARASEEPAGKRREGEWLVKGRVPQVLPLGAGLAEPPLPGSCGFHRPLRVGILRIFSWSNTMPWMRASALGGQPGT